MLIVKYKLKIHRLLALFWSHEVSIRLIGFYMLHIGYQLTAKILRFNLLKCLDFFCNSEGNLTVSLQVNKPE